MENIRVMRLVSLTALISTGATSLGGRIHFTGSSAQFSGASSLKGLTGFCGVAATLKPSSDSDIKIDVWMPLSGWNGKFQAVGNRG